jgi:uncharacterized membrane protein
VPVTERPAVAHDHSRPPAASSHRVRLVLAGCLVPFVVLTVVGAVLLWPSQRTFPTPPQFRTAAGAAVTYVHGTTRSVQPAACETGGPVGTCTIAHVTLSSGADAAVLLTNDASQPVVHVGDHVVLAKTADENGRAVYYFDDFSRGRPLLVLTVLFVVLALAIGRRRGLTAILGLGVVFAVLVEFLLPALLSGGNPLFLALVSGSGVMIVVLYLGHGVSARTTVAVLGTLSGLVLVGGLGALAVGPARLTGLGSDDFTALSSVTHHLDVAGLLLAGLVIGSLGVLNDVTVTQASAVWELHEANPELGRGRLYSAAMRIGRDHIASTIYTLLLAYAGAALPVLLLFTVASEPLGVVLNGDLVASDIVRSLVGAIGLLLAVPLTTAIGVLAATSPTSATSAGATAPARGRHR